MHINKMLFFMMTIMSSLMVLSSSNWLSTWIGLEINLMSIMPLMYKHKNSPSSESCMIYFMVQAISSMVMLFSIIIHPMNLMLSLPDINNMLITLSMMMKLGMPPFHYWLLSVMSKCNWQMCLLLMSWQKLAPMMILSLMNFNMLMAIIANLTGVLTAINQTDLRKIMASSSMSHMGWMMTCMKESNMWMLYLVLYSAISALLILFFMKNNILFISQMMKLNSNFEKMTLIMLMMSMGGMPPFTGFIPKWMSIQFMVMNNQLLLALVMTMLSILAMFYYLRIMNSILMLQSSKMKWMLIINHSKNYWILIVNGLISTLLFLIK